MGSDRFSRECLGSMGRGTHSGRISLRRIPGGSSGPRDDVARSSRMWTFTRSRTSRFRVSCLPKGTFERIAWPKRPDGSAVASVTRPSPLLQKQAYTAGGGGRGGDSTRSSSPPWSGSGGSTITACSARSRGGVEEEFNGHHTPRRGSWSSRKRVSGDPGVAHPLSRVLSVPRCTLSLRWNLLDGIGKAHLDDVTLPRRGCNWDVAGRPRSKWPRCESSRSTPLSLGIKMPGNGQDPRCPGAS